MNNSIGHDIKLIRTRKGVSLLEAASYLNISQSLLNEIEKGKVLVSKHHVFKMAGFFGLDARDWLVKFQTERIFNEGKGLESEYEEASSIIKNKGIALRRFQNMQHELNKLRDGNLNIIVKKPCEPLQLFINNMVYYNGHGFGRTFETIMPDGAVQLFFDLDGCGREIIKSNETSEKTRVKSAWIVGTQKQRYANLLKASQAVLCLQFHPQGFYAFTKIPQIELSDAVIDADLVFGSSIHALREEIMNCSLSEVFQKVENYFLKKISHPAIPDPVVEFVINNIEKPVSFLAEKTGYSQKHLIHTFKKQTGLTPKYFQRLYRFNKVLNQLHTSRGAVDWASLVFNNKYFDQAHFVKEFAHFSGYTPQSYIEAGSTCTKQVHSDHYR